MPTVDAMLRIAPAPLEEINVMARGSVPAPT